MSTFGMPSTSRKKARARSGSPAYSTACAAVIIALKCRSTASSRVETAVEIEIDRTVTA